MPSLCRASACSAIAVLFLACANGAELEAGVLPDPDFATGGADSGLDAPAGNGGGQSGTVGVDEGAGGALLSGGAPGSGGTAANGGQATRGSGGQASGAGGASMGGGGRSSTGGANSGGKSASGGAVSGGTTGAGGSTNSGGASPGCGAKEKTCNNACVPYAPANGCNGSGCTACQGPAPDHGLLTCNAQGDCDFDCLSGFTRSGSGCVSSTGGGSGGSSGTGGSGGTLMCGNDTCKACNQSNTVACCDKLLGRCTCALSNLQSLLCK